MNKTALLKLKSNPFYKMSDEQKKEAETFEHKPMVEFGVPPVNKNVFVKHDVKVSRRKKK